MADINDIVAVDITIQDSAPKAVAFDTIAIVADAPFTGGRLYSVSPQGLAAMTTDGFPSWSRARQLLSRMSGQSGGAAEAYIWGRTANQTQALEVTVDTTATAVGRAIAGNVSYGGITSPISITVVTNTVDAILDLLEAAIDASLAGLAGIVTTPDNATATKLVVSNAVPGTFVLFDGFPHSILLTDVSAAGTNFADELAALNVDLGAAAYGLLLDGFSKSEAVIAAAFAETNRKIFLAQSADNSILTSATTDVASTLQTSGYTRSAVFVSRYMSGDHAAALLGRQLGQVPGSSNWALQVLTGVPSDKFTSAEHAFARGKHALTYTTDLVVAHTWDGWAASGRYFDVTHGVDALRSDIQTREYQVLLNAEKVPFNGTGSAMFEAALRASLTAAEGDVGVPGLIEPGWTVTMPNLVGYSPVDKAARRFRTGRWTATMTGAASSLDIAGTLTL